VAGGVTGGRNGVPPPTTTGYGAFMAALDHGWATLVAADQPIDAG